eukprot:1157459-Pelagomonas_calceolata.AAC.10
MSSTPITINAPLTALCAAGGRLLHAALQFPDRVQAGRQQQGGGARFSRESACPLAGRHGRAATPSERIDHFLSTTRAPHTVILSLDTALGHPITADFWTFLESGKPAHPTSPSYTVRTSLESGKPFTPLYTRPQSIPSWDASEASHEAKAPALAAHLSMRAAAVRAKQVGVL